MKRNQLKIISIFFSVLMTLLLLGDNITVFAVGTGTDGTTVTAELMFSDDGITETVSGSGYSINGTTLTISSAGTYELTGSCSEGAIVVKKELSDVVLLLNGLDIASSTTAPIIIKGSSSVTIHLTGTNTLTDSEDAGEEDTNENFEGACIKAKSGSIVTFCGSGTLNVNGTAKNGIKGAATANLIFNDGIYNITAANNAIASDGSIVINGGTFTIDSENDGIKSAPESTDTDSEGTLTINGGNFTVNADGDAIQAEVLTINNGDFNITTLDGYASTSFDADTMSCKGLKASGDREVDNTLNVNGGTFVLNTADDALHSDGNATISYGTFTIETGDDAVHADEVLTLSEENGLERNPEFTINACYEGLEGSNVYIYSGKYYIVASDDGINAAGGSSSGTDGTTPGESDSFRPGSSGTQSSTQTGDYNFYVYGGDIYIDCGGDGLDSNGGLYLYGGMLTVLSQGTGGDNSPLDSENGVVIDGATVFGAGTNPMNETPDSSSQAYTTTGSSSSMGRPGANQSQSSTYSEGSIVAVTMDGALVYNETMTKGVNYIIYSSPEMASNSSATISTGTSLDTCKSNVWKHGWNSGQEADGIITYNCNACTATEQKTVIEEVSLVCNGHDVSEETREETEGETEEGTEESEEEISTEAATGYTATFVTGENASINIYYTKDYTEADEKNVTTALSRNSDTGEIDASGSGQINFEVIPADGYEVDSITIEGSYKNLKDSADTGVENVYRITKISSDLVVVVTVKETEITESDTSEDVSSSEEASSEEETSSSEEESSEEEESSSEEASSEEETSTSEEASSEEESSSSDEETITVKKIKVTTRSTTEGKNVIKWKKSSDADGYIIMRRTSKTGVWEEIADISDVSTVRYEDTEVISRTRYYYTVKAYVNTDDGKVYAEYENDTTGVKTSIATVVMGTVTSENGTNTVTWEPIDNISGYVIKRKTEGGNWITVGVVAGADKSRFNDSKSLTAGTDYVYTVFAMGYKLDKTDSYSKYGGFDKTGVTVTATLKIPTFKRVTATTGKVILKWNKISGADGYIVYRKVEGASKWSVLTTIASGTKLSYVDTTVKKGTEYVYTLKAYYKNSEGNTINGNYDITGKTVTAK